MSHERATQNMQRSRQAQHVLRSFNSAPELHQASTLAGAALVLRRWSGGSPKHLTAVAHQHHTHAVPYGTHACAVTC
jgi:hypothetical protein